MFSVYMTLKQTNKYNDNQKLLTEGNLLFYILHWWEKVLEKFLRATNRRKNWDK